MSNIEIILAEKLIEFINEYGIREGDSDDLVEYYLQPPVVVRAYRLLEDITEEVPSD